MASQHCATFLSVIRSFPLSLWSPSGVERVDPQMLTAQWQRTIARMCTCQNWQNCSTNFPHKPALRHAKFGHLVRQDVLTAAVFFITFPPFCAHLSCVEECASWFSSLFADTKKRMARLTLGHGFTGCDGGMVWRTARSAGYGNRMPEWHATSIHGTRHRLPATYLPPKTVLPKQMLPLQMIRKGKKDGSVLQIQNFWGSAILWKVLHKMLHVHFKKFKM